MSKLLIVLVLLCSSAVLAVNTKHKTVRQLIRARILDKGQIRQLNSNHVSLHEEPEHHEPEPAPIPPPQEEAPTPAHEELAPPAPEAPLVVATETPDEVDKEAKKDELVAEHLLTHHDASNAQDVHNLDEHIEKTVAEIKQDLKEDLGAAQLTKLTDALENVAHAEDTVADAVDVVVPPVEHTEPAEQHHEAPDEQHHEAPAEQHPEAPAEPRTEAPAEPRTEAPAEPQAPAEPPSKAPPAEPEGESKYVERRPKVDLPAEQAPQAPPAHTETEGRSKYAERPPKVEEQAPALPPAESSAAQTLADETVVEHIIDAVEKVESQKLAASEVEVKEQEVPRTPAQEFSQAEAEKELVNKEKHEEESILNELQHEEKVLEQKEASAPPQEQTTIAELIDTVKSEITEVQEEVVADNEETIALDKEIRESESPNAVRV